MAQKAQVLDIGTYSAKRVRTRVPLVGYGVDSAVEIVLDSARESRTRKSEQLKAAKELLPGKRLTGDSITLALPAEKTLNRTVEMPFADRSKLDSVLGFELENHVPLAADEFLYDYLVLDKRKDGATLAVSMLPEKEVEELLEAFASFNIDPRVVGNQATANGRLAELLSETPGGRVAFVDMGHRKTIVTLMDGRRFAGTRVILHGGYDLTRAIQDQFSTTPEEAENEKHATHLFPAGEGQAVGRVQDVADCLSQALRPLLRDLHQTLRTLGPVESLYLFGGGARLGGVDAHLSAALDLPVTLLYPSMLKLSVAGEADQLQNVPAIAMGYSAHKGSDGQRINFRQGHFAYQGDFRFMRGRLIYLGALLLFLVAAFGAPQVMRYQSVLEQEEQLRSELLALSMKVLGEEYEDADEILDLLAGMPSADVWTVFPDLTAHDTYWEVADIIARIDGQPTGEMMMPAVPDEKPEESVLEGSAPLSPGMESPGPEDPVATGGDGAEEMPTGPVMAVHHLEMNQIRIDGASRTALGDGNVEFTGNASSVATMELFLGTVGKHPCFHNVQRTKQEMLKATAGKEGWWRFSVEFTVSCPRKAAEELARERDEGAGKEAEVEGSGKGESKEKDKGAASESEAPKSAPLTGPPPTKSERKAPAARGPKGPAAKESPSTGVKEKGPGEEGAGDSTDPGAARKAARNKLLKERAAKAAASRSAPTAARSAGSTERTPASTARTAVGRTTPASTSRRMNRPNARTLRSGRPTLPTVPVNPPVMKGRE